MRQIAAMCALAVVMAMAVFPGSPAVHAQAKVDVTGVWAFEVQTEAGTGTPQVSFKQDGEKLTGHYSSTYVGEANLTGSVKGQVIQFSFTANVQGNAIELTFTGTVEDGNSMKGKVSFGGMGEGTFTGKRK